MQFARMACMYGYMTDHVAIIKGKIEKAESRVLRYRKSLESAESELRDLHTALRVLEGIASGVEGVASSVPSTMGRQLEILRLLTVGREKGQPPADLYKSYIRLGGEDITIDTFRTTIWRMKDRVFEMHGAQWVVHGDGGNYWREPLEEPERDPPEADRQPGGASESFPWDDDYVAPWENDEESPF